MYMYVVIREGRVVSPASENAHLLSMKRIMTGACHAHCLQADQTANLGAR